MEIIFIAKPVAMLLKTGHQFRPAEGQLGLGFAGALKVLDGNTAIVHR